MGLKTTNYEVKKLGIALPNAYAIITDLRLDRKKGYATFAIQATRDNAENLNPIDTVKVTFDVNLNENPFITAYREAASQRIVEMYDPHTGNMVEQLVNMPFYGWTNDIVGGSSLW